MKLSIELVPKTCWFSNVRSHVSAGDWEKIKSFTFGLAKYKCEICGGRGHKHPVECHEVWDYDDSTKTQTLKRTIALCPMCHQAKHLGLQIHLGRFDRTVAHIRKVNNLIGVEADKYIMKCFEVHDERSKHDWHLDISWLEAKLPFKVKIKGQA